MKKLSAFLACLLLLSLLAGCQNTEQTTEPSTDASTIEPSSTLPPETEPPETEPTEESTEEPTEAQVLYYPEELPNPYVVDLYRDTKVSEEGYEYFDAIPFICLPGSDVEAINAKIQRITGFDGWENYGYYSEFDYSWHVNEDILTLILSCKFDVNYTYDIFNIDLKTCTLLTNDDILALYDLSTEDFKKHCADLTADALFESLGEDGCKEYFGDLPNYSWPIDMFVNTTDTWLEFAVPYPDKKGNLCFRAMIAQPAGADSHDVLLRFDTEVSRNPYYDICEDYLESLD